MSFLPALTPTPEEKKKKVTELLGILEHTGQSWKKFEWEESWWGVMGGCWGWDTRPWAVFDSIRWGQQGQTQDWVLRAESPSLCSVWKLSQLCSLILQLNQSRGKSEQKWVCGGAGVHVGLGDGEGRRQWGRMETMGNGCCPSQHVPPLQHLDELPSLSPLSRAQIWHSEGFFFPLPNPKSF